MKPKIISSPVLTAKLEFTPLEFETYDKCEGDIDNYLLEFTPLEFETYHNAGEHIKGSELEFTPLEFETLYLMKLKQWHQAY